MRSERLPGLLAGLAAAGLAASPLHAQAPHGVGVCGRPDLVIPLPTVPGRPARHDDGATACHACCLRKRDALCRPKGDEPV